MIFVIFILSFKASINSQYITEVYTYIILCAYMHYYIQVSSITDVALKRTTTVKYRHRSNIPAL